MMGKQINRSFDYHKYLTGLNLWVKGEWLERETLTPYKSLNPNINLQ